MTNEIEANGWDVFVNPPAVTVNTRDVGGVLCRWWGDGPAPAGVAMIDAAAAIQHGAGSVDSISDDMGFPDVLGDFIRACEEKRALSGSLPLTRYIDAWHSASLARAAAPTDLSKRLRAASTNFATTLLQSDILAAADEIDRLAALATKGGAA